MTKKAKKVPAKPEPKKKASSKPAPKTAKKVPAPKVKKTAPEPKKVAEEVAKRIREDQDSKATPPTPSEEAKFTPLTSVPKEMEEARERARVLRDNNSRTVIEMRREDGQVVCVLFNTEEDDVRSGVRVARIGAHDFDHKYEQLKLKDEDYPPERAARLFVGFMQDVGGTEEAIDELARLTPITPKEREYAMAKGKPSIATANKGKVKEAKAAQPKKAAAKAPAKGEKKSSTPRGESAAALFKKLILEGKKTDQAIFEEVQKKFPNVKRSYVSWYRNDLKKKGENPPAAKAA